jgi:hypothetical protein
MIRKQLCILLFLLAAIALARADAVYLLEEPYGRMGAFDPTGHSAVYLTRVCASSPTRLRRCQKDEAGVVISRYHRIAGRDWLAMPLVGYLYAVDGVGDIPELADVQSVWQLRDSYRRKHFLALVPNDAEGNSPPGDWTQLVGSVYDRKIYGFQIETTAKQDDVFIRRYNARKNKTQYSLFFANCADFARNVMNFYAPHSVHRNYFADAGVTSPKQVAKSLAHYAQRHQGLELSSFEISQVPGSIPRSRRVDDVAEGLLKSKKYSVPLTILSPPVTGGLALLYLAEGRFNPAKGAGVFDINSATHPEGEASEQSGIYGAHNFSRPTRSP